MDLGPFIYNKPRKFIRNIMHGLDPDPLQTIYPPAAIQEDGRKVEITGPRYLGSYSWLTGRTPRILVPGAPRIWVDRPTPFTLSPDSGFQSCDHNAYQLPPYPLLPIFLAVTTTFDWSSVDVVADCHSFLRLIAFATGQRHDFRMDLQLAGSKTVLCTRWEPKVLMSADPGGYGRNFERMLTRPAPGCTNAASHHRVITYDLAGMKLVVRAEVDACLPSGKAAAAHAQQQQQPHVPPQSALVELTTKSKNNCSRASRMAYKHMQMCLAQTPNLICGTHQYGVFGKVVRREMSDEGRGQREAKLRLLRDALGSIQQLVVDAGRGGRLTLVYKDRVLKLYRRSSMNSLLPEEYMRMFQPNASVFFRLFNR
ncbi:uncharacterized protein BT62DRAFT_643654 [Guyanagaster necrorhizus]|uniref:Uncharacterized protein n=1 Tax=Guyanagaster necrorhizus TaxID=856835 RepID=A0A9P7VHL8_9AGAR|nr:uncharacterized protein BT62DRAFT_643654 [Guyanagaster necrorhizus MCA 3950]KAG7440084.1 hypothetical protein BT62DRAFT_643654 [Guyanagaster necrorhizus MCA 3950]